MALLFADSWDHYRQISGTQYANDGKWDRPTTFQLDPGRRGSSGLSLSRQPASGGGFFPSMCRKNFAPTTQVIAGCYAFIGSESNSSLDSNAAIGELGGGGFGFMFGTDDYLYIRVGLTSDGRFIVSRSTYPQNSRDDGGGSYVGSGLRVRLFETESGVWTFGQWNSLEVRVLSSYTAGEVEVRVNGVQVVDLSAIRTVPYNNAETIAAGNLGTINPAAMTQFGLASLGNGGGSVVDDVYLLDTTGSTNNTFLDRWQVDLLLPDGVGLRSASTIGGTTPAASRWEGARTPDQGVSYNNLAATDDSDSFSFEDLPYTESTIYGVQVVAQSRRSDSGFARMALTNDVNAATADASPALLTPSAGSAYAFAEAQLDAAADGAWTLQKVQDSEFGYRREVLP